MNLFQESWKNSSDIFLVSEDHTISYGQLYNDLIEMRAGIGRTFSPSKKKLFVLEAKNSYQTYLKFLSLILENHTVFLSPDFQFNDASFREFLESETRSSFHYVSHDEGFTSFQDEGLSSHPLIVKRLENNQASFIVRTSGTSGARFKFILHEPSLFIKKYELTKDHFQKTLAFFPAESIAGIETLLEVVTRSKTLITHPSKLKPVHVSHLISSHGIDLLHVTPSFLNLMLMAGAFDKTLESLKLIAFGSEPVSHNTLREIKKRQPHISFKHIYGMSEIGLLETMTNQDDPSSFKLDENINQAQLKGDALEVKTSTPGLGYLNHHNLESSWFKTGDVASIDSQGFMKILGRSDDLINIGGKKFYPSEVENFLIDMAGVLDVVVISEKNEIVGQILIANFFIDPAIDEFTFRAALKTYCEKSMPPYMCPQKIFLLKEPPITSRFKKSRTV